MYNYTSIYYINVMYIIYRQIIGPYLFKCIYKQIIFIYIYMIFIYIVGNATFSIFHERLNSAPIPLRSDSSAITISE